MASDVDDDIQAEKQVQNSLQRAALESCRSFHSQAGERPTLSSFDTAEDAMEHMAAGVPSKIPQSSPGLPSVHSPKHGDLRSFSESADVFNLVEGKGSATDHLQDRNSDGFRKVLKRKQCTPPSIPRPKISRTDAGMAIGLQTSPLGSEQPHVAFDNDISMEDVSTMAARLPRTTNEASTTPAVASPNESRGTKSSVFSNPWSKFASFDNFRGFIGDKTGTVLPDSTVKYWASKEVDRVGEVDETVDHPFRVTLLNHCEAQDQAPSALKAESVDEDLAAVGGTFSKPQPRISASTLEVSGPREEDHSTMEEEPANILANGQVDQCDALGLSWAKSLCDIAVTRSERYTKEPKTNRPQKGQTKAGQAAATLVDGVKHGGAKTSKRQRNRLAKSEEGRRTRKEKNRMREKRKAMKRATKLQNQDNQGLQNKKSKMQKMQKEKRTRNKIPIQNFIALPALSLRTTPESERQDHASPPYSRHFQSSRVHRREIGSIHESIRY